MSRFKKMLTKDAGWKLLSVIIAVFLWFMVINIENPVEYRVFSSSINIENSDLLSSAGKTITNMDSLEGTRVAVRLRGERMVLDKIQQARSLSAYIDISEIDIYSASGDITLPIRLRTGLTGGDTVSIEYISPSTFTVNIDESMSKTFDVTVQYSGNAGGATVSEKTIDPQKVTVTGARGVIESIESVKAMITLDSPYDGQTVPARINAYDADGNVVGNVSLSSDTAVVTLNVETTKRVPIQVSTSGEPARGCSVSDISVEPDSITLVGSEEDLADIMYITLPDIDVDEISLSFITIYDITPYIPRNVTLSEGSQSIVRVNVEITGQEENVVSFSSDDIQIEGTLGEGLSAEVERDTFNIIVSGSGLEANDITYSVDVTGLSEGEHRVQVDINLPEGVTVTGGEPYATVIVTSNTGDNVEESSENVSNGDETGESSGNGENTETEEQ